jgi:hypothetical protein
MRTRHRIVAAFAATVMTTLALVVVPGSPASADLIYPTCEGVTGERCVVLQTNNEHEIRVVGSLEDDTWGNDTVAVVAYLEVLELTPAGRWRWRVIAESQRVEGNNFALTATAWKPCRSETYRGRINWNYKRGQNTGSLVTTPDYRISGC